ncbi:FXYD domain-containing ion transport regulator 6-like [Ranitomeya imitator]|uniref:FXYD domain-containing ion transport regulator 6-like n=1 Tax=Ranitomeya imitator TaxID=111125 RepID=UPI0037E807E7
MSCKGAQCCLLILSAVLFTGCAAEHDRFHYDYWTLRIGGLVFAGVMLTMGGLVLLSDFNLFERKKKPKCKVTSES